MAKYTLTKKELPYLNKDIEFDVSFENDFTKPRIIFYSEDILEKVEKISTATNVNPTKVHKPFVFNTFVLDKDVVIEPGTMTIDYSDTIIKYIDEFFREIVLEGGLYNEYNKYFEIETVSKLINLCIRKLLIEKMRF